MELTEKQIQELINSINALATQFYNVDLRLQAFLEKFGPVIKAIRPPSQEKD